MKKDPWSDYLRATSDKLPSTLLVQALSYIKEKGEALDLGAGALVDTHYLLQKGFKVTAVDSAKSFSEYAQKISNQGFKYVVSAFDAFIFKPNTYDLISAQWALPFNPQETFHKMFLDLKRSLKKDGIFVGQLFGINDEWNDKKGSMTFHTKEEVQQLFADMKIIYLLEEENDTPTAAGIIKHWHVFHVIAEKVGNN